MSDLLVRMTRFEWPTIDDERLDFLASLGLRDTGAGESKADEPDSTWHSLGTPWPSVHGIDTVYREEFLGFSLFRYEEHGSDGALARAGFAGLRKLLSDALGPPVQEWGTLHEPACFWRPGPLTIEMYCFQRHSSGVMVGPSHTERSAANDAAHDQAPPQE